MERAAADFITELLVQDMDHSRDRCCLEYSGHVRGKHSRLGNGSSMRFGLEEMLQEAPFGTPRMVRGAGKDSYGQGCTVLSEYTS
jgi:hypothetical protein